MLSRKLDRLAEQAMKANREKRYADESRLWARIYRELPNRYDILCNLASAKMLAAFYIVFDPTESARAIEHEGSSLSTRQVGEVSIETVVVRLRPPVPSRIA